MIDKNKSKCSLIYGGDMSQYEKASFAWLALTNILTLRRDANAKTVIEHLDKTYKSYILAVQFILLGSGFATEKLVADGDFGQETMKSLETIYDFLS